MRSSLLLTSALVATAFVVGCEWTSSDGISWDESYDNVNFSGTYPIGKIAVPVSGTDDAVTDTSTASAVSSKSTTDTFSGVQSGTVRHTPLVADSSYSISVTYVSAYTAGGKENGTKTSSLAAAVGEVAGSEDAGVSGAVYANGSWAVNVNGVKNFEVAQKNGVKTPVKSVQISYTYSTVNGTDVPTVNGKDSESSMISSVTVHQTGQHITMTMSNGSTFTGNISGFDYNADSVQAASVVIAKYSVSGKDGSINGTLNSGTATRTIDGVWTNGGDSWSFTGSCAGAGRSVGSSVEAE